MKQKTKYFLFFSVIAAVTIFIFRPIKASTADMDAKNCRILPKISCRTERNHASRICGAVYPPWAKTAKVTKDAE